MSEPVIIQPSQLYSIDRAILEMQDKLSTAEYQDSSGTQRFFFEKGIIIPCVEKDKSGIPKVYQGKDEYYSLEPNDRFSSLAFFYEDDPRPSPKIGFWNLNMNLVVWYNQDQFGKYDYRIKNAFINEIYTKLFNNSTRNIDRSSVEVYRDDPYSDFILPETERDHMDSPYDGFRFKFIITGIRQDCGEIFISSNDKGC